MISSRQLQDLVDRRNTLTSEAKQLIQRAGPGGLSGADLDRFEELETEITAAQDKHRTISDIVSRIESGEMQLTSGDGGVPAEPLRDPFGSGGRDVFDPHRGNPWQAMRGIADSNPFHVNQSEIRSRALTAVEYASGVTDLAKQHMTRYLETETHSRAHEWALVTTDPAYLRAFSKVLLDPVSGHMTWDTAEHEAFSRAEHLKRAMSLTDGAGGYLVPFTLDASVIVTNTGVVDPIRRIARTETISTDAWNGVTSAGVTAEWKTEAAETADASPTLTQPSIPVHFADAFVPASFEITGDSNLTAQLGRLFADAKARHEAAAFTNGTGTGQPTGIVTALDGTASEVAPATAETFVADDVYSTLEALPARHRPNASWLAGLPTINTVHRFHNPSGSEPPLIDGDRLLRKRYYESSSLRDTGDINTAATADNHILIVGDFHEYLIVDRIGSTLELVPHLVGSNQRPTGQRGFLFWWRVGASVSHIDAFRALNIATTA